MSTLKSFGILFLALAILAVVWNFFRDKPVPIGEYHAAKQDKRIADIPTKTIQPKGGVVVIDDGAKDKLGLPDEVKKNPKQHVTAAVTVPPDEHPKSIVTVFDEESGQTSTLTTRLGFPLLAAEERGQVWVGYGIKNGLARVGRFTLREDLLQVKALHAGLNASLDTDGQFFVGAGVGLRW